MITLFKARGLVFLGESVLQHEIFKEFACESKDRPKIIELLEKINRMYENVTFTDIVSYDVIDNDKQVTKEIVLYPIVKKLTCVPEKEKNYDKF